MSWANVIPFWILMAEAEEREAKALCAFQDEIDSGFMYSTPSEVVTYFVAETNKAYNEEW